MKKCFTKELHSINENMKNVMKTNIVTEAMNKAVSILSFPSLAVMTSHYDFYYKYNRDYFIILWLTPLSQCLQHYNFECRMFHQWLISSTTAEGFFQLILWRTAPCVVSNVRQCLTKASFILHFSINAPPRLQCLTSNGHSFFHFFEHIFSHCVHTTAKFFPTTSRLTFDDLLGVCIVF